MRTNALGFFFYLPFLESSNLEKNFLLHVEVQRVSSLRKQSRICVQERIYDLSFSDWVTSVNILQSSDVHFPKISIFYNR